MAKMQYCGTGRRKSSVARVRLIPGTGVITVNKKDLNDYFGMEIVKREVRRPLEVAGVLAGIGVDLCGFSNNHIFDYGKQGVTDTINALKKA
ncbi:MAG: 30S ribosomal protein S9, partial [Lachnospiraceae bacterium]|nr:30S ribosomal protein S9 [Lachnospiraceae bacterium]